jgi:hypothetical protein
MLESQPKSDRPKLRVALLLANGGRTRLIRRLVSLGLLAAAFAVTVDLLKHGTGTAFTRGEIWDIVGTAVGTAVIVNAFFAFPLWLVQEHVRRKRNSSGTDGA